MSPRSWRQHMVAPKEIARRIPSLSNALTMKLLPAYRTWGPASCKHQLSHVYFSKWRTTSCSLVRPVLMVSFQGSCARLPIDFSGAISSCVSLYFSPSASTTSTMPILLVVPPVKHMAIICTSLLPAPSYCKTVSHRWSYLDPSGCVATGRLQPSAAIAPHLSLSRNYLGNLNCCLFAYFPTTLKFKFRLLIF